MFTDLLALTRPKVSLAVGAATIAGAIAHGVSEPWAVVQAAVGSIILCGGCSALNQWQEKRTDSLMRRTWDRPLPSGRMDAPTAIVIVLALISVGLGLFLFAGSWTLFILGLLVVAIYNGLYTPLKSVTTLSLLVGGISGALPPIVGWVAAGGAPFAPTALAMGGALYLWQVPHFWAIAERNAGDYRAAGLAVPSDTFPQASYRRIKALWVAATVTALALVAALLYNGLAPLAQSAA